MKNESTPILFPGERVSRPSEASLPYVQYSFVIPRELSDKLRNRFNDFDHEPINAIDALLSSVDEEKYSAYKRKYHHEVWKNEVEE